MRKITRGASGNSGLIFHIFVQDSTSTSGAGKASLAFGDFSCRYIRNGEALSGAITPQDIATIGTYAAPTANTNIRIKAVDNTNAIGIYEVQIHADWVNTTNACQSLTIYLTASGAATLPIQIPLVADDEQTAKPSNFNLLGIDGSGNLSGSVASVVGAVGSVTGNVGGSVASVASGGLSAASFAANSITAAALAADVTTELQSGLATAAALADVPTVAEFEARTLVAADYFVVGDYTAPPSAATIADAVWDETLADHLTAGSTGAGLNAAGSAGDPWATALPGAYGAGTAGKIVGDNLNATVSSRSTLDAAGVRTAVGLASANLDTQLADLPTVAEFEARTIAAGDYFVVGDYTTPPTAAANADALLGRNIGGGSSTGRTVEQALAFLRNKWTLSGGTLTVYDTDDTTVLWTATVATDAAADPVTGSTPA